MEGSNLVQRFEETGAITKEEAISILRDNDQRRALYDLYKSLPNRAFAVAFLERAIALRSIDRWGKDFDPIYAVTAADLLFVSLLLSKCGNVEDSLLIYKAKTVDFDTACGFDIQMVVFAGVEETLRFLSTQDSNQAKYLSEDIKDGKDAGDFDDLKRYFSDEYANSFIIDGDL